MLTIWLNRLVIIVTTEEQILSAARKVFMIKGLAGARMQDIANEAGINKALLHYYFRSKDKLFEHVFLELTKNFIPQIISILESDLPLFEKIEHFCRLYIGSIKETPFIPLFVINEINRQPDEFLNRMWGRKKPNLSVLRQQIEGAIRKKQIRNIDPMQLILHMVSLCIFPFLAKPMMQRLGSLSDKAYEQLITERINEVPAFIIESIKLRDK